MSESANIRPARRSVLADLGDGLIQPAPFVPLESQVQNGRRLRDLQTWIGDVSPEDIANGLRMAETGDLTQVMLLYDLIERRDARLGGMVSLRRSTAAAVEPQVVARNASPLAEQIADEIRDEFWAAVDKPAREGIAQALAVEVSVSEIHWTRRRTGRVGIDRITFVPSDALRVTDGEVRLLTKSSAWAGEPLTPNRYIVHWHPCRPGRVGTRALLEPLLVLFMCRNFSWKDWTIFAEVYGTPFRSANYPASWNRGQINYLLSLLKQFGVSGYGAFPEGSAITIHESSRGAKGTTPFEAIMAWAAEDAAIRILGQTLTTSQGETGALALGQVHDRVRADITDGDVDLICSSLMHQVARPLALWNHGREDLTPFVQRPQRRTEDMAMVRENLKTAISLGVPVSVGHVAERLNVELADDGETLAAAAPSVLPFGGGMLTAPLAGAEERQIAGEQDVSVTAEAVLNGAQIQAARQIVSDVAVGLMPRDAGLGQLVVLFNLTQAQAEQIMGAAGTASWKPAATGQVTAARIGRADRDQAVGIADRAAEQPFDFAVWLRQQAADWRSLEALAALRITEPPAALVESLAAPILLADLAGRASWARRQDEARKRPETRRTAGRSGQSSHGLRASPRAAQASALAGQPAITFEGVPFQEAIENLRTRLALSPEAFAKLSAAARKRAFTAAGLSTQTALETLQRQVTTAVEQGQTYRQFLDGLDASMEQAGYAGERPSRVYQVYHDAVMSAYGAGQWEQAQETASEFPFWQYLATGGEMGDGRTRPEHRALHGRVFRLDDAQAAAFWPPWDHGCRCDARPMTAAMVEAEGLEVEGGADVRATPVTLQSEGRTVVVVPRPKPAWDAPPDGRLENA